MTATAPTQTTTTNAFNTAAPPPPPANVPGISNAQTRAELGWLASMGLFLEKASDPNVVAEYFDIALEYLDLIFTRLFDQEHFEVKALAMGFDPYNRRTDGADPEANTTTNSTTSTPPTVPPTLATIMNHAQATMGGLEPGSPESYKAAASAVKLITTLIPNKDLLLNAGLLNAIAAEANDPLDSSAENFQATRLTATAIHTASQLNADIDRKNQDKPADEQTPRVNPYMLANQAWETVMDLENNINSGTGLNALINDTLNPNDANPTSQENAKTFIFNSIAIQMDLTKKLGNDIGDQYLSAIAVINGEAIDTNNDGEMNTIGLGTVQTVADALGKDIQDLELKDWMDYAKEHKEDVGNEDIKAAYDTITKNSAMFFDPAVRDSLADHKPSTVFERPAPQNAPTID